MASLPTWLQGCGAGEVGKVCCLDFVQRKRGKGRHPVDSVDFEDAVWIVTPTYCPGSPHERETDLVNEY